MAKKKAKKSKAGPIAVGVAALAAIGLLTPSDEEPVSEEVTPPAIIEEAEQPEGTPVENLVVDMQEPEEPVKEEVVQEAIPAPKTEPQKEEPVREPQEQPVVEIDPEQAFREKLNQYNYVGSIESDKYHYPRCRWTDTINDSNLVHFDTEEEAVAAGYLPCGTCHP